MPVRHQDEKTLKIHRHSLILDKAGSGFFCSSRYNVVGRTK